MQQNEKILNNINNLQRLAHSLNHDLAIIQQLMQYYHIPSLQNDTAIHSNELTPSQTKEIFINNLNNLTCQSVKS